MEALLKQRNQISIEIGLSIMFARPFLARTMDTQFISTHIVSSLSIFSINEPLFLQKTTMTCQIIVQQTFLFFVKKTPTQPF